MKTSTILITGDLSFLHDLSALITMNKYDIKFVIIVINNDGGGIFASLPIANKVKGFKEYFLTPHNMDLKEITNSFGIDYQLITNPKKFNKALSEMTIKNLPLVLEIKTDAQKAVIQREKYFSEVKKKLNKEFSK